VALGYAVAKVELTLTDTAQQFNSRDGDRRRFEPPEADHRTQPRFHPAMILLDHIIQIFRESNLCLSRQFTISFHLAHRAM
jgi:hypothetical protein